MTELYFLKHWLLQVQQGVAGRLRFVPFGADGRAFDI